MPKRRRKREQPMMHPSCRPQQQPQHFLWGCIMRFKVRYAPLRRLELGSWLLPGRRVAELELELWGQNSGRRRLMFILLGVGDQHSGIVVLLKSSRQCSLYYLLTYLLALA